MYMEEEYPGKTLFCRRLSTFHIRTPDICHEERQIKDRDSPLPQARWIARQTTSIACVPRTHWACRAGIQGIELEAHALSTSYHLQEEARLRRGCGPFERRNCLLETGTRQDYPGDNEPTVQRQIKNKCSVWGQKLLPRQELLSWRMEINSIWDLLRR